MLTRSDFADRCRVMIAAGNGTEERGFYGPTRGVTKEAICPVGQNTRHPVNPSAQKYSTLPKFGIAA